MIARLRLPCVCVTVLYENRVGQDCITSVCRAGRCCVDSVEDMESCGSCNATGMCSACFPPQTVVDGRCVNPPGGRCWDNSQCDSRSCRGGVCCKHSVSSLCTSCSGSRSGRCTVCPEGLHPDISTGLVCEPDEPRQAAGTKCFSSESCSSRTCLGNVCCSERSPSGACRACNDARGGCTACASGYQLVQGSCRGPQGAVCASDQQCASGVCRDGHCCVEGTVPACSSCTYYGTCIACPPDFFLGGPSGCLQSGWSHAQCSAFHCCATCNSLLSDH
jgi:hypothetical protein